MSHPEFTTRCRYYLSFAADSAMAWHNIICIGRPTDFALTPTWSLVAWQWVDFCLLEDEQAMESCHVLGHGVACVGVMSCVRPWCCLCRLVASVA